MTDDHRLGELKALLGPPPSDLEVICVLLHQRCHQGRWATTPKPESPYVHDCAAHEETARDVLTILEAQRSEPLSHSLSWERERVAQMLEREALNCEEGQCYNHSDGLRLGATLIRESAKETTCPKP